MSKFVVLGLEGEAGFWLVDFQRGSVTPVDADMVDAIGDVDEELEDSAESLRPLARRSGVNLAVAATMRPEAATQKMWFGG
jgi:hypothetical protein